MNSARQPQTTSREVQRARARAAWADFRDRLATITPAALGRAALAIAVVVVILTAVIGTWPALLPFAIGGLLAYAVLPVVDFLDRFLPRWLAALVSILGVIAVIVGVVVTVVPTLVTALIEFAQVIPGASQIDEEVTKLLADLPEGTRDVVGPIMIAVAAAAQDTLSGASGGLRDLVGVLVRAAPQVAGAVLGLIVLPTWVLTVMSSNRRGRIVLDRSLAGWLRPDFWAIVRLLDRAAGTYLRGFVVVAAVVGLLTWLGLLASPQVGGPQFRAPLAIATFAGVVQVIPELGPILGFFPALLLVVIDPQRAAVYIAIYLVARFLGGNLLGGRLMEDRLGVHPAILIPGVVVLSQLGPLALLLSAPILGFGSDAVRYMHGRLSEPPRPAGVLPGEPVPQAPTVASSRVPYADRRRAAATRTRAPIPTR